MDEKILEITHKNRSLSVPDEGYSLSVPDEGYSLSVPDEGYSRNMSCTLNLISTILFYYFTDITIMSLFSIMML
jgi:hypothetical protein